MTLWLVEGNLTEQVVVEKVNLLGDRHPEAR